MNQRPRTFVPMIFAVAAAVIFQPAVSVLASATAPPLSTIIAQAIARDEETQKALRSMEYHQLIVTERLDQNGRVIQKQELQMIVRPGAAQEIQVVSEKGDELPTNPDEASLQAEGRKAQKQKVDLSLKELAGRFTITLAGTDAIAGQPAYVIGFEPKSGQPYRNQTERVLNHLQGKMWISARDYSVLRTDAALAAPVEIAWIFAQVGALNFHYELDNGMGGFGPAQILTSVEVTAPFINITQRIKMDLSQFQPRTKG